MAFHEVRFPDDISRGARGGPQRRTQVVELASGDEERNASWASSRRRYDVAYGIRRADDLAASRIGPITSPACRRRSPPPLIRRSALVTPAPKHSSW
jgi:hypothetical protein